MRSDWPKWGWRRWAMGVATAMAASASPAWAGCSMLLPSCWSERVDAVCAAAPTRACVFDLRLRLLDRLMSGDAEAAREIFFSQSFDMTIGSPVLEERRRVVALGERHGFQPDRFGVAVKLFAEDRTDWRAPLARGDFAAAIAAVPDPALSVSYQWLDGVVDTIFVDALRLGRAGEVLDAIATGRLDSTNWSSARDHLYDRWFRRLIRGDRALAERLIGLAAPQRARSMRLAMAATATDPALLAASFAREFPAERSVHDDEDTNSVWRAFGFLESEPVAVRERFLDAMPRFVSTDTTGPTSAWLDGPVGRGEVGVVRRLVARTLPDEEVSGVYQYAAGMRSDAIARTLGELDPPDRQAATVMMVEALIAEGAWDRAGKVVSGRDALDRLTGAKGEPHRARAIAERFILAGKAKSAKPLFASFDTDTAEAISAHVGATQGAEKMLSLLAEDPVRLTQGTPFDEVDDAILTAAWDLAQERGDCRGMLAAARNRHAARSEIDYARDLDWVASCVARKEEASR